MIKTLAHICLVSQDLARTVEFYCDTLGLRKKFDFLKDGKVFGFYLEIDDRHFIEVFHGDGAAGNAHRPLTHFCLEVDDLAEMRQRLLSRGISASEKTLGCDGSWQLWCKDPDGIDIEFHQYTPESSQFTGRPCLANW